MAALSVNVLSIAGVAPTYVAAAVGGDTANGPNNDERLFIHVKNGGGSAVTVTINPVAPTQAKVAGAGVLSVPAISVSVPATTGDRMIGPIPQAYYDASSNVNISYSAVTSVTVAAIRVPTISL